MAGAGIGASRWMNGRAEASSDVNNRGSLKVRALLPDADVVSP